MRIDWRPPARVIRDSLRRAGIEVSRAAPTLAEFRSKLLQTCSVTVDIGANVGQWGAEIRAQGYLGPLMSVEPYSEAFKKLHKRAAGDPNWTTLHAAISDRSGSASLQLSLNSVSSSLHKVLPAHADAAPSSRVIGIEKVQMLSLDELLLTQGISTEGIYIKIDTQGHEKAVLLGGTGALAKAGALEIELSLVPLYENQELLPHLSTWLYDRGFELVSMEKVFWDRETGSLLQVDGLFVPRSSRPRLSADRPAEGRRAAEPTRARKRARADDARGRSHGRN